MKTCRNRSGSGHFPSGSCRNSMGTDRNRRDVVANENKVIKLESRSLAAQNGGRAETSLMHQTETVWDDAMRKMARYVERIANDDPAIVLYAGINLSKQPLPYQRPELSAKQGESRGQPCCVVRQYREPNPISGNIASIPCLKTNQVGRLPQPRAKLQPRLTI